MMPRAIACALLAALLAACGGDPPGTSGPAAEEHGDAEIGVTLSEEDLARLGVVLGQIGDASFQPALDGRALVVDAQTVIGPLADLAKAETDARTSQTALKRARDLFRSDTAVSAGTLEAAERQASADDSQVKVARARATLGFGAGAPWLDARRRDALLDELASGSTLLVSMSFPSGLGDAQPEAVELRRVGSREAPRWHATEVWAGPADPNVPGPTLFALLRGANGLGSGERLTASLASGAPAAGTVVPLSSVVLLGGEAWCYARAEGDTLVRKPVDLSRPLAEGYFQSQGYEVGEPVVIAGAGLLLAREVGGGAEED